MVANVDKKLVISAEEEKLEEKQLLLTLMTHCSVARKCSVVMETVHMSSWEFMESSRMFPLSSSISMIWRRESYVTWGALFDWLW